MKDLIISFPTGSSRLPENTYGAVKTGVALSQTHFRHTKRPPNPPFLIPGVLEILRTDQKWGPLVEIVPGEADMYCAEYVRQHGGIVLTTDSDLLVTDLGVDGGVSFFDDVTHIGNSPASVGLTALKFSSHAINDLLRLDNVGGLGRVAFEIQKHGLSLKEAKPRAEAIALTDSEQSEFREFMEEYSFKTYLPNDHAIQGILSTLDARIAEIVVQALTLDGSGADDRGPRRMGMFLPVMIEDRSKKSAWHMSTAVRELAYGVLQRFSPYQARTVIEYRLLDASDRLGRVVDVPGPKELLEQCSLLSSTLKQIAGRFSDDKKQTLWLAFAVSQDILWSKLEQRAPLSTSLINNSKGNENNGSPTPGNKEEGAYDWDIIHFTARVQATFYSLRMAKQFLEVVVHLSKKDDLILPTPMIELREQLKDLPPISEWPLVEDMSLALTAARKVKVLAAVTDILGLPAIESEDTSPSQESKPKIQKGVWRALEAASEQRKAEKRNRQPASVNRFAALSIA